MSIFLWDKRALIGTPGTPVCTPNEDAALRRLRGVSASVADEDLPRAVVEAPQPSRVDRAAAALARPSSARASGRWSPASTALHTASQVEVATAVDTFGSTLLQQQLAAVQRGQLFDRAKAMGRDLARLRRDRPVGPGVPPPALGRVVRFTVADPSGSDGAVREYAVHRGLLCARSPRCCAPYLLG